MIKKIAIIGAGPAGLTAGYEISKNPDFESVVFERKEVVGGMARSFSLFDQIVDVGPHRFFSNDTRVNTIWLEVIGKEYKMVDRVTRIFYKKKYFDYPLRPFNALMTLGIYETFLCILSYFFYKVFPEKDTHTFKGWVTNRFGKRLYEIFFKSYTEKLWGIPCDQLTSEFAQQRIKKFSLGEAILSAFNFNKKKHKTLVDQFAYPIKGNGYVYEKMKDIYLNNGGKISFDANIESIDHVNGKYEIKVGNEVMVFDQLISSMPISDFFRLFAPTTKSVLDALNHLSFRNTIIVYVKIESENLFSDQWLYIQDEKITCGRITNFSNWVPDILNNQKGTVLALEYWCYESDEIWNASYEIIKDGAIKDLINCNFIKSESDVSGYKVIRVPKCYPVYDKFYKPKLDEVVEFAKKFDGLQFVGRYGSFKYNNQDHSILMGHLAARNILFGEENDIWDINTDYEYQESSIITSTGLVQQ